MKNLQTAVPALVIRRTFAAPRERVFAAWTDPALVEQWFCPPEMAVQSVTCDARLGGTYRIETRTAAGEAYNVRGSYTEFDPPQHLAFTFCWEEDDPALEHETLVRIDFIARGEATEMTFTQDRFASDESRNNHEAGWTAIFDQLATLAAS